MPLTAEDIRLINEIIEQRVKNIKVSRKEFNLLCDLIVKMEQRLSPVEDRLTRPEEIVVKLDQRITLLEERIEKLEKRITNLEEVIVKLDQRITLLEEWVGKLEERIEKLDEIIIRLDKRITLLEERVAKIEEKFEDRTMKIEEMIKQLADLSLIAKVSYLEKQLEKKN